jgi:hypothetical protein
MAARPRPSRLHFSLSWWSASTASTVWATQAHELRKLGAEKPDGRGYYRALLPVPVRGESRRGVFVGAAFFAAADALVVGFLALVVGFLALVIAFSGLVVAFVALVGGFLAEAVCCFTETVEPDTRVLDDGLRVGDFESWVFSVAVACLDAGLRPWPLAITLSTPGPGIRLVCSPESQRTVMSVSLIAATVPVRGPDFDEATSMRSPISGIPISSLKTWRERSTGRRR